jgi:hypothetical protein
MFSLNRLSAHPALESTASLIHVMGEIAKRFRP